MSKPTECKICGCTEANPCMTSEGPCSWAVGMRAGHICSACIVTLPPDPIRDKYLGHDLIIEKVCINCALLIKYQISGKEAYTCEIGRFDSDLNATRGSYQWFDWSGVRRPNKTVMKARRSCKEWKLHPRWQPKASVLAVHKTVTMMRRLAEREFGHLELGQKLKTDKIEEHEPEHEYEVVHVDDHNVIFEREKKYWEM